MTSEDTAARAYLDRNAEVPGLADLAWATYEAIRMRIADDWMRPTIGCSNSGETIGFYWDDGVKHSSIDVVVGEPAYCFFRDRATGDYWGDEVAEGGGPWSFPDRFVAEIRGIIDGWRADRLARDISNENLERYG